MMKTCCLALALLLAASPARAYTVVSASSSAPAGIEQLFIANATTTFNAGLVVNPLFPGTYQITLQGLLPPNPAILVDSGTYSFVFGEGMETERAQDINNLAGPDVNCDASPYCLGLSSSTALVAPGNFKTYTSTYAVHLDAVTCVAVVCRIAGDLYQQNYAPAQIQP
jgi:hypothetical protein